MKEATKLGTGAILLVLTCAPILAADDVTLVRILAKADLAHNLAYYCAQYDPSIIERTKSQVGDAQALMRHMRSEVTSGLPQAEAAQIVLRSANAARTNALLAIRKHYGPDPQEERARIAEWCEKTVVPSVKDLVASHDHHHEILDQEIERAKENQRSPYGSGPSQRG